MDKPVEKTPKLNRSNMNWPWQ